MAGTKKKKKPASNPARGFATTSIASKPKVDQSQDKADSGEVPNTTSQANTKDEHDAVAVTTSTQNATATELQKTLTPEEFEKQLEETELQTLVEKHAQKSKREAARQATRLYTDRRILRSQAEPLFTRKWLSAELMDTILDLIKTDHRMSGQPPGTDISSTKTLSEEDLTIRLWTLQQTLATAGFPEDKIQACLRHILELAGKISTSNKDMIFGLEESLEWLARECDKEELPDYENWQRKHAPTASKSQLDSSLDTPSSSGTATPRMSDADMRHIALNGTPGQTQVSSGTTQEAKKSAQPAKRTRKPVEYESDIDPDDLLPVYLETKKKLFLLQAPKDIDRAPLKRLAARNKKTGSTDTPEIAKLQRKLKKIEDDVLFDKYDADQKWSSKRIQLEREASAARNAAAFEAQNKEDTSEVDEVESEDEVSKEAARIGAEMLETEDSDDDGALADLFASLPVTEVDTATGKSSTVVNGSDGSKIVIRDFGKWTGVSPRRVLEDACRARDSSVKFVYKVISSSSFSNRHSLQINWSKSQEVLPESAFAAIECFSSPKSTTINMTSISTPDSQQSEAYVSTTALYMIFGSSAKEDKVFLRLPPVWRELWNEFQEVKKDLVDTADRESIRVLRDVIRHKRDREEEDGVVLTTAFKKRGALLTPNDTSDESGNDKPGKGSLTQEALKAIWWDKMNAPSYQHMLQSRMQLPMFGFKEEVLRTIDREQVVIICGETGCGKSTQVPAFILEHQLSQGKPCKIYCTEPRRISAISLARRVSEELGERKNDLGTPRSLVGYAIRLESNTSKETRLVYATTGIVMRMLEGSNDLNDITHIVLDEVHERTIDSDFLLIVLRKLMTRRPDLKVVLMSATVDADRFSKYLDGAPVLNVPGRTFPVQVKYLEDAVELTGYSLEKGYQYRVTDLDDSDTEEIQGPSTKVDGITELQGYSARTRNTLKQIDEYRIDFDLVAQLIAKIAYDDQYSVYSKAILVFLPGIGEIRQLNDMIVGHPAFAQGWFVYPLHSTIASEDQEAAFLVPPEGTRKIVLATNIAETGITIPDVTCVIDTGKHREMRFDERRQLSRLLESFISRANAKQRRGRAGRVQEGLCFHMFTKHRHDNIMADQQTPELLRLSLQDLAIRVKICKLGGIEDTLGQALDPPSTKNIRRAVDALVDVKALTSAEELTPLGQQLARLPLDVFLGKLILLGSIFKCLDAAITVAAILSSKSPFSAPFGSRSQADTIRLAFKRGDSDLLTVYNAYIAWKRVCNTNGSEYQFCRKNFLNIQTLSNIEDLKGQLVVSLVDSGFLPLTDAERSALNKTRFTQRRRTFFELPQRSNLNSDNDLITTSVIAWSFYPKLLVRDGKGWRNVANNQNISLHPSSVNKGRNELRWLSYYHIMQAKQFYNAHETTGVEDFAIALLCGDVRCDMYAGVFILDGNRARFAVPDWKYMLAIKTLRARLRDVLTKSFRNPGKPLTAQQMKWMDVWQKIFTQEPKENVRS